MFESIKRRPCRAVKVGVAAAVAVAAGGAFFASQAGAAPLQLPKTRNIMLKAPSGIGCATVMDNAPDGRTRDYREYDYAGLRWNPQAFNSTGIVATAGDTVQVWLHKGNCRTVNFDTVQTYKNAASFNVGPRVPFQRWSESVFLDNTHGPVI
jgi:hypothetical protein